MANVKSGSKPAGGAQVLNLADFQKNPKAPRKPSAEETLREHERVFASLSFHLLSCARLIAELDKSEVRHG
ncbi:hypothetical protein [Burkholderia anthina]|uniref:hypothetical protein n=1 Tax=Burkholderia anthina TaxID=179879 RepID=UPI0012DA7A26|nr:hypothetical protein [Burkholderia anthina]